jgi:hypothetical protein
MLTARSCGITTQTPTIADYARSVELIERYADLGLGLVDARVVTVAERLTCEGPPRPSRRSRSNATAWNRHNRARSNFDDLNE